MREEQRKILKSEEGEVSQWCSSAQFDTFIESWYDLILESKEAALLKRREGKNVTGEEIELTNRQIQLELKLLVQSIVQEYIRRYCSQHNSRHS